MSCPSAGRDRPHASRTGRPARRVRSRWDRRPRAPTHLPRRPRPASWRGDEIRLDARVPARRPRIHGVERHARGAPVPATIDVPPGLVPVVVTMDPRWPIRAGPAGAGGRRPGSGHPPRSPAARRHPSGTTARLGRHRAQPQRSCEPGSCAVPTRRASCSCRLRRRGRVGRVRRSPIPSPCASGRALPPGTAPRSRSEMQVGRTHVWVIAWASTGVARLVRTARRRACRRRARRADLARRGGDVGRRRRRPPSSCTWRPIPSPSRSPSSRPTGCSPPTC